MTLGQLMRTGERPDGDEMRVPWPARTTGNIPWAARFLVCVALAASAGCAQVPGVEKFLYATNADRDNDALADDVATVDGNDAAAGDAQLDVDATLDGDVAADGGPDADTNGLDATGSDAADAGLDGDAVADVADAGDAGWETDASADTAPDLDADSGADTDTGPACVPPSCNDDNTCTTDACVAGTGCVHLPWTTTACDDQNACTTDTCDTVKGCVHTPIDATIQCADGNACTVDLCEDDTGCVHPPADCSDGTVCTTDSCDAALGCQNVVISCDDGKPCTGDSCDATLGCVQVALTGTPCDDEDACTLNDTCAAGTCAGTALVCGSPNPCMVASCNSATGCVSGFADGKSCDDGDACTSDDSCALGGCVGLPRLWQMAVPSDQTALAIAARPAGGFVTVSHQLKGLTLRAWSKGGALDWTQSFSTSAARAGVTVASNGDVAAVGGDNNDGFIHIYSSSGALIADTVVPSGSNGYLAAVIADALGGYHAMGWLQGASGDPGDVWLADIDAAGKVTASFPTGGPSFDAIYAATTASDGNSIVGGVASTSTGSQPFLLKAAHGALVKNAPEIWTYGFPCIGAGHFNAVAPASDGGVLAIGEADVVGDGVLRVILVRVSGAGKRLWSYVDPGKTSNNVGSSVAPLKDGRWLITAVNDGVVTETALQDDGSVIWSHALGSGGETLLAALGDGTVGIAGSLKGSVYAQRSDGYGNADCTTSGTCLDKTWTDCSDANVCTSDECKFGACGHPSQFFGTTCSDGNACHGGSTCSSGSCVGGSDLLGFLNPAGYGEGTQIAARPDGSWVIATSAGMPVGLTVIAYSSTGSQLWTKTYTGISAQAMFVDSGGNTLVLGYNMSGWLRRISSAGTETASWDINPKGVTLSGLSGGIESAQGGYTLLAHGGSDGYLLRVDAAGTVNNYSTVPGSIERGIVAAPDGNVYFSGQTLSAGAWVSFVAKYTPYGQKLWRYDDPAPAGSLGAAFTAPALLPDGGCAVASASDSVRVFRFAPDGALKATDTFGLGLAPGGNPPAAIATTSDGSVLVTTATGTSPTLWRVDPQGNVVNNVSIPASPGPSMPISIATSSQDRVGLVSAAGNPLSLAFWRLDGFLNGTCAESGNCAGLLTTSCDSKNSCVLDDCNGGFCSQTTRAAGSPCSDASACTVGDFCAGGTCTSGSPVLGSWTGKADTAAAVAAWGQGSVTVGQVNTPDFHAIAVKRDATGATTWTTNSASQHEVFDSHVGIDSSSNVLIPGHDITADAGWIWQLDTTGGTIGTGFTFGANNNSEFRAILANGTAGFYAVGTTGKSLANGRDFWLVPLTSALGQNGSDWTFGTSDNAGNGNHDTAHAAALANDGSVYIVGTSASQGVLSSSAHVRRVDPTTGSTYWQFTNNGSNGMMATANDVVATSDGGCLVAGSVYGKSSQDLWIARFNNNGQQQWSRSVDDSGGNGTDDFAYGAAALADDSFAVVGRTKDAHLWRFDALGTSLGDWSLGGGTASRVAVANTGGLLIAATAASPLSDVLYHTDLYGNVVCAVSGPCFDYTTLSCDDSNPCTLDICAGACKHVNVTDGTGCEDGDPCTTLETCTAGVCSNGKPTLWSAVEPSGTAAIASIGIQNNNVVSASSFGASATVRAWDPSGAALGSGSGKGVLVANGRMQVNGDGSFVVAGHTVGGTDADGWIGKFNSDESAAWVTTPGIAGSADALNAVVPRQAGGYWGVGSHLGGTGAMVCWVQAFNENKGAALTSEDVGIAGTAVSCQNARGANDGSFLVVGSASSGLTSGFVAKLNADGSQKWNATFAGSAVTFYDGIPLVDGGAIVVGTTGTAKSDVILVRYDAFGLKMWVRTLDFNGTDEGHSLNLRMDGSLDVAGQCADQFCLMHLSASGFKLWYQTFGVGRALSLMPLSYNTLVLAGESATNQLLRVDWSGNATCATSGNCIDYGQTDCSASNDCAFNQCILGKCTYANVADGGACDDGQSCTGGDFCSSGKCKTATGSTCGDGLCTCGDTVASCPQDCP